MIPEVAGMPSQCASKDAANCRCRAWCMDLPMPQPAQLSNPIHLNTQKETPPSCGRKRSSKARDQIAGAFISRSFSQDASKVAMKILRAASRICFMVVSVYRSKESNARAACKAAMAWIVEIGDGLQPQIEGLKRFRKAQAHWIDQGIPWRGLRPGDCFVVPGKEVFLVVRRQMAVKKHSQNKKRKRLGITIKKMPCILRWAFRACLSCAVRRSCLPAFSSWLRDRDRTAPNGRCRRSCQCAC